MCLSRVKSQFQFDQLLRWDQLTELTVSTRVVQRLKTTVRVGIVASRAALESSSNASPGWRCRCYCSCIIDTEKRAQQSPIPLLTEPRGRGLDVKLIRDTLTKGIDVPKNVEWIWFYFSHTGAQTVLMYLFASFRLLFCHSPILVLALTISEDQSIHLYFVFQIFSSPTRLRKFEHSNLDSDSRLSRHV